MIRKITKEKRVQLKWHNTAGGRNHQVTNLEASEMTASAKLLES